MPLTCDCYGGCWGAHAKDRNWTPIEWTAERERYTFNRIEYGTYVIMNKRIYFESEDDAVLVIAAS